MYFNLVIRTSDRQSLNGDHLSNSYSFQRYDTHPSTVHFLMRLLPSEEPVGTIRAVRLPEYYKLTRLVVAKPYRKYRLGRSLVLALHEYVVQDARERGATPGSTITCVSSSQIPVKNFYAR